MGGKLYREEGEEVGGRTRRRPKRKGLCRGTDAEGGMSGHSAERMEHRGKNEGRRGNSEGGMTGHSAERMEHSVKSEGRKGNSESGIGNFLIADFRFQIADCSFMIRVN
jgi:hypothetical protein